MLLGVSSWFTELSSLTCWLVNAALVLRQTSDKEHFKIMLCFLFRPNHMGGVHYEMRGRRFRLQERHYFKGTGPDEHNHWVPLIRFFANARSTRECLLTKRPIFGNCTLLYTSFYLEPSYLAEINLTKQWVRPSECVMSLNEPLSIKPYIIFHRMTNGKNIWFSSQAMSLRCIVS